MERKESLNFGVKVKVSASAEMRQILSKQTNKTGLGATSGYWVVVGGSKA